MLRRCTPLPPPARPHPLGRDPCVCMFLQVVAHADERDFLVGAPPAASVNGTATATMKVARMLGYACFVGLLWDGRRAAMSGWTSCCVCDAPSWLDGWHSTHPHHPSHPSPRLLPSLGREGIPADRLLPLQGEAGDLADAASFEPSPAVKQLRKRLSWLPRGLLRFAKIGVHTPGSIAVVHEPRWVLPGRSAHLRSACKGEARQADAHLRTRRACRGCC